jgi:hypothetical protein
VRKISF